MPTPEPGAGHTRAAAQGREQETEPSPTELPSTIVGLVIAFVAALSIWYLARPQPLLVQGKVDAMRFDIAARVDGRVAEILSSAAKTSRPVQHLADPTCVVPPSR